MPRVRKWKSYWSIQGYYPGSGWEEVTAEDTWKQARERLKEYRANEPGTAFRARTKKERIEGVQTTSNRRRNGKRNPSTYGTSYFVSLSAAVRYYKDYGDDREDVQRKIREGSIHIGKPPLKPGERLGLTDGGKRYTITTANPKRRSNGRSYVRKGVSIGVPRYSFDPKTGDKFYVSGKLVTIKRVDQEGMLWFNRDVDGTVAMSASNLYQAAYVPEDSRFAPYEYRIKKNPTPIRLKVGKKIYNGTARKVNGKVKVYLPPNVVAKINPDRRWDIHEIKDANRAAGLHFFDAETLKFFHSKVYPTVYQGPGGVYFVTSEYRDSPSDREYAVRQFNVSNAHIRTETKYSDKNSAVAHAKRSANR